MFLHTKALALTPYKKADCIRVSNVRMTDETSAPGSRSSHLGTLLHWEAAGGVDSKTQAHIAHGASRLAPLLASTKPSTSVSVCVTELGL